VTTLELTTLVYEPLHLAVPMPVGWSVQASDESESLTIVGTDEFGNDTLNPSIRVDRKGPSVPWRQLADIADGSLGEMRSTYLEFHLHWSREMRDRVVRGYSYVHEDMGPVGQVQGIIDAGGVILLTCSAPRETFDRLMSTFEQIVTSVEKARPANDADEQDSAGD
jgi:hypothetical protein